MNLRPYQIESKECILDEWTRVDRTLLVLPTGTGKTIVFCKLIEDLIKEAKGYRILILAHRGELLKQAADKMQQATGLGCSVEKADETALGTWNSITVGSVQTMMRPTRLERFKKDYYTHIVVDEAHHVLANSYQTILDYFEKAKVLGVTATPDRTDLKNLGQFFETKAYEYTLPRAIKEGYLVPIKALTIPLKLDLSGCSTGSGDYQLERVGNMLDPFLEQIAEEMTEHCKGRKTVMFLPLIATSQKMRDILVEKGFRVAEINGNSKDRDQILKDFNNGLYDVLCNSMLLTEGWDCPPVDCIVCLRPTKSRPLYVQICGRGTRPSPETGKEYLLLLDFLWNSEKHELCRPAHLIATCEEVSKKMTEKLEENPGAEMDLEELEVSAEGDCIEAREEALAKKLAEMKNKKRALVDPLQFEMSIKAEDLASYVPAFGWESAPASEAQIDALAKCGIQPSEISNAGKASLILDKVNKRRIEGLSSPKQIRLLEKYRFPNVGTWTYKKAKSHVDQIAGAGWRVPDHLKKFQTEKK